MLPASFFLIEVGMYFQWTASKRKDGVNEQTMLEFNREGFLCDLQRVASLFLL